MSNKTQAERQARMKKLNSAITRAELDKARRNEVISMWLRVPLLLTVMMAISITIIFKLTR